MIGIIGLVISVIGVILTLALLPSSKDFVIRKLRKAKMRIKSIPTRSEDVVEYRCPLVFRKGSSPLETSFAEPVDEQYLLSQILKRGERVLVLGQAGTGKSQLTSHVERYLSRYKRTYYRAYLSVEKLHTDQLKQRLAHQLSPASLETSHRLGKSEHAVIIIDGLDEVNQADRVELLEAVEEWVSGGASVLVTARSIDSLPDRFHRGYSGCTFTIQPLSETQVIEIIDRWCKLEGIDDPFPLKNVARSFFEDKVTSWEVGNGDTELSSPFYLVNTCDYYANYGKLMFGLDPKFQFDLSSGRISERLRQEFGGKGIELSQSAKILVKKIGERWLIDDEDNKQIYFVRREKDRIRVYQRDMPASRLDVLEMIVENRIYGIKPQYRGISRDMLLEIAKFTSESADIVSVPRVKEKALGEHLGSWLNTKEASLDYQSIFRMLLDTHLIVEMGDSISFGIHGLVYHYFAAEYHVTHRKSSAKDLQDQDRATVEFVSLMMSREDAIQLSINLLELVKKGFPWPEPIRIAHGRIDPRLPYFALASVKDVPKQIVDHFVEFSISRFEIAHGMTRWTAVEMLAALDRHIASSEKFTESIKRGCGEVAAALAEVICWLGQRRSDWRQWALEQLDLIISHASDPHPLLHVVEAVERLGLSYQTNALELLSKLSEEKDVVVRFSAISMLGSDMTLWKELGTCLIDWIVEAERSGKPDYFVYHGYYALHWLEHPEYGENEAIEGARTKIMERIKILAETYEPDKLPSYWIWYLGKPIERLGLIEDCQELLGRILSDSRFPSDTQSLVERFVSSVRRRRRL